MMPKRLISWLQRQLRTANQAASPYPAEASADHDLAACRTALNVILQASSDALMVVTPAGQLLAMNPVCAQLWRISANSVSLPLVANEERAPATAKVAPDNAAPVWPLMRQGQPVSDGGFRGSHRLSDGRVLAFAGSVLNLPGMPGLTLLRWYEVGDDQTEQERMRGEKAALQTAQSLAQLGRWEVDLVRGQTHCDWMSQVLLGRDPQGSPPTVKEVMHLIHEADKVRMKEVFSRPVPALDGMQVQFRIQTAAGELRWIEGAARVVTDAEGQPLRMVGTLRDFSERRERWFEHMLMESIVAKISELVLVTEGDDRGGTERFISFVNDALLRRTGFQRDELLGKPPQVLMGPLTDPSTLHRIAAAAIAGSTVAEDVIVYAKSGESFWVESQMVHVRDEVQGKLLMVAIGRDVTARRDAERANREQSGLLSAVIDQAQDAIIGSDAQGHIVLFNPAAERIFGQGAQWAIGQPVDVYLQTDPQKSALRGTAGLAQEAGVGNPDGVRRMRGRRSDGQMLELEVAASDTQVGGRRLVTSIVRDVTERSRSEAAMERYRQELSSLTQRLMAQEKDTAARLAQALHDQLGQTLTALQFSIDGARALSAADEHPPWARQFERLQSLNEKAIQELRLVLVDLRPPLLEEQGLWAALSNEVQHLRDSGAVEELVLCPTAMASELRWPNEVEYAAYMVAREALSNARKHALARKITVRVDGAADHLELEVRDDGKGMSERDQQVRRGHLGLVGIRERARAIDAELDIESPPDGGTCVRLLWARHR